MIPATEGVTAALATLLREQPLSPGKVSLAWSAAVGSTVAGVTTVELDREGGLAVTTADQHWVRELNRSRTVITKRLNQLLGDGIVKRIEISSGAREHRPSRRRDGHR